MKNKFTESMEKRSDSELLEIVTKMQDDYQPEAVEAAEIELERRNLSIEQMEQAKQEIKEKEISIAEKENEPLRFEQKILFFIFCWGYIPWAMAGTYRAKGYKRKYKEA